ncbi:MAG TPA: hypothetical protein P5509_04605 [Bacteroidales bacterium]|nr:hypothetical protein [Bacteroidales bacterium]
MVVGIEKFKEYFKDFTESYIIIGGTACDIILDDAGFTPRTTKDIDIILIVEALELEFVKQFWAFIKEADYERKEKSDEKQKYYRFLNPKNKAFPKQVELFSRIPDIDLEEGTHLTPIPVDNDISSLSAILLDDDYYNYTIEHSSVENNINIANTEALICLKAKAFLDMTEQEAQGAKIDSKNIRKHKTDIFRMATMLTAEDEFELPNSIKEDLQSFAEMVKDDLPDKQIFKQLGIPDIDVNDLFKQFLGNFKLNLD